MDEISQAIARLKRDAVTHYQNHANGFAANSISNELTDLLRACDYQNRNWHSPIVTETLLALARKINGDRLGPE